LFERDLSSTIAEQKKLKIVSLWIELAGGLLDYLSHEEYHWIPFFFSFFQPLSE